MVSTIIAGSTLFLVGSTIYLNVNSESGGPVHWHADIEFWVCDAEVELRDPVGRFSNKIGTPTYHEHDDKRIHLEGVVVEKARDASLGKFLEVVGGSLSDERIVIPSEPLIFEDDLDGDQIDERYKEDVRSFAKTDENGRTYLELTNDKKCGDKEAELQVFVYEYNEKDDTYKQKKLDKPASHVIRDTALVPPGDCIIVEFAPKTDHTHRLCQQYGVRDNIRCEEFGVTNKTDELCNIEEVDTGDFTHNDGNSHDDSESNDHHDMANASLVEKCSVYTNEDGTYREDLSFVAEHVIEGFDYKTECEGYRFDLECGFQVGLGETTKECDEYLENLSSEEVY